MQLHNSIVNVIGAVLLLESADALMRLTRLLRKIVIATNAACLRLNADALTDLLKHLMQRDVLFVKAFYIFRHLKHRL